MRKKILVLTAVGVSALGIATHPVQARTNTRTVRVDFTSASSAPAIGAIECDAAGRCVASYSLDSTYEGDIEATSITTGALTIDQTTGASEGSSYQIITGSIDGCGTGSFIVRLPSFVGQPPEPTVARGSVVAGSGTGDLAGLTGRLSVEFTTGADGTGSAAGHFKLRCSSRP